MINQPYDKLSKLSCRAFANASLRFVGEPPGIKNVYTYEIYTNDSKLKVLDLVIESFNGYCIHFEFHKLETSEKLVLRNIQYSIDFRVENDKLVKPYMLIMGEKEKSETKGQIGPNWQVEIDSIFFKDYDGDRILNDIKTKLDNNVRLDEDDLFNIIFIPFMTHEKSNSDITKELCHLINKIDIEEDDKYKIKLCQLILVDIFIDENEKEEVIDVVKMRSNFLNNYEKKLVQTAEKNGEEKGKIEGIKEGMKEGMREGIKEGIKEGMKEGIEKSKVEIALKMKKDKIPIEKITTYTGLTPKTIQNL